MIFAITVANTKSDNIELSQSLSDDFSDNKSYSLRSEK